MSLEDAIEQLTAALVANNALLQTLVDRGALNGANKPTSAETVAVSEPVVNTPVVSAAPEKRRGRPPKKTVPTEDQLRAAFGGYLSVKDKAERDERKTNVAAILQHFAVDRATEIPEDQWAEAISYVEKLAAGEKPDFMNESAEDETADDEEEEDAMI